MSGCEFSVWVGCLACYNGGSLVGDWRDPDEAEDWECPHCPDGTETWVFDVDTDLCSAVAHEMSPTEAKAIGEALAACEEAGYPPHAYALWCANVGEKVADWADNEDSFMDSYRGEYGSLQAYAEELFDELYLHDMPEGVRPYIDYEKFARDLEYDGYWEADGYVFGP